MPEKTLVVGHGERRHGNFEDAFRCSWMSVGDARCFVIMASRSRF